MQTIQMGPRHSVPYSRGWKISEQSHSTTFQLLHLLPTFHVISRLRRKQTGNQSQLQPFQIHLHLPIHPPTPKPHHAVSSHRSPRRKISKPFQIHRHKSANVATVIATTTFFRIGIVLPNAIHVLVFLPVVFACHPCCACTEIILDL